MASQSGTEGHLIMVMRSGSLMVNDGTQAHPIS